MGARAMSARKMRRDALTVRAPDAEHDQLAIELEGKGRTTFGRSGIALEVPHQLPDETTPDETCAGKGDQQTWVERVVE
jgi:hypothetical protein